MLTSLSSGSRKPHTNVKLSQKLTQSQRHCWYLPWVGNWASCSQYTNHPLVAQYTHVCGTVHSLVAQYTHVLPALLWSQPSSAIGSPWESPSSNKLSSYCFHPTLTIALINFIRKIISSLSLKSFFCKLIRECSKTFLDESFCCLLRKPAIASSKKRSSASRNL